VVQQRDELAAGHRQRVVRGGDDPTVGSAMHHADAGVVCRKRVEGGADLRPRRAIVDEAPLPVFERL
jgi:hypothetical protein